MQSRFYYLYASTQPWRVSIYLQLRTYRLLGVTTAACQCILALTGSPKGRVLVFGENSQLSLRTEECYIRLYNYLCCMLCICQSILYSGHFKCKQTQLKQITQQLSSLHCSNNLSNLLLHIKSAAYTVSRVLYNMGISLEVQAVRCD